MADFVKRSGLAQPNDSTWLAIFGVSPSNRSTVFRPIEHTQPPKRRVFGELDPINPRGQQFNGSSTSSFIDKPANKRLHDGSLKAGKENTQPFVNKENDENALPKPRPQVSLILSYKRLFDLQVMAPKPFNGMEPPNKRQSLSTSTPAPLLPQFPIPNLVRTKKWMIYK
jgi:hypothetical protein